MTEHRAKNRPTAKVKLHPATVKAIKDGHPWITKDKYTDQFPENEWFLHGVDSKGNVCCSFVHDPDHPTVKGRIWSTKQLNPKRFLDDIEVRLESAISKRSVLLKRDERENVYITFGETDLLPGLFILKLSNPILIQYYTYWWPKYAPQIISTIRKKLDVSRNNFWLQKRGDPNDPDCIPYANSPKAPNSVIRRINEFGINYQLFLGDHYDIGIYTDMAYIRSKIQNELKADSSLLNLFSYTGAFSLIGLKNKCHVTSVDLSEKYMNLLNSNVALNPLFDANNHKPIVADIGEAIRDLTKNGKSFNAIICDPPAHFSSGKGSLSIMKFYRQYILQMTKLLAQGGSLYIFGNMHSMTFKKFRTEITSMLDKSSFEITRSYRLGQDCPTTRAFPEGDYLKGLLIEQKANRA